MELDHNALSNDLGCLWQQLYHRLDVAQISRFLFRMPNKSLLSLDRVCDANVAVPLLLKDRKSARRWPADALLNRFIGKRLPPKHDKTVIAIDRHLINDHRQDSLDSSYAQLLLEL